MSTFTNGEGNYHFQWAMNCDANEFSALITTTGLGWVGFGLNTQTIMVGAYVIQSHVVDGTVAYQPGHNIDYIPPQAITTDIYRNVNGSENSTHTVIGFTRNITLSPEFESLHSISPSGNIMVFSFQDTSDDFTVMHSTYQPLQINYFTGKTSLPTDYKLIHGALMLLAFGFLAPAGTFVARYLKGIGHPWYLIHIGIQYSLLAIVISSFIIIEHDLGPLKSNHFQHPHNVIGLTIVILTLFQVLLGILSNAFFKPNREGAPAFPDKVHWWLGRLVILYSIASIFSGVFLTDIFIGFHQYGFNSESDAPYIGFAVWLGVATLLFIFAEVISGQSHHTNEGGNIWEAHKKTIVTYIGMFVAGFIIYGVTLHEMYHYRIQ